MWRGGCIIRSVFLADITKAYRAEPDLENLLFNDFFKTAIHNAQPGWRRAVSKGVEFGIPTPAFSTALSFYDGYRTKDLPANLLQAQRDYFGMYLSRHLDYGANIQLQVPTHSVSSPSAPPSRCPRVRTSTSTGPEEEETFRPPPTSHRSKNLINFG